MGEASFFLNYGYVSSGDGDEAAVDVPEDVAEPQLDPPRPRARRRHGARRGATSLDVGCGRGGTAALLAERFGATLRRRRPLAGSHRVLPRTRIVRPAPALRGGRRRAPSVRRRSRSTSSRTSSRRTPIPDMRAFLGEVTPGAPTGRLVPAHRPAGGPALDGGEGDPRRARVHHRSTTATSPPTSWRRATRWPRTAREAFGARDATIDNFLAVPGSPVYEQMASGAWEYRIVRSQLGS